MIHPNVLKSKNDNRNIYTYELPNKLRVYIINDNDTDIACATMMVKIGYFQDTVPGIAHFLEHMLFNGTSKYPDEKLFSSFISKNNGTQNAYTAHDHTCYYFSIAQDSLNQGLEMFGDFFISPLLNKDCVNREKEAVHSEHIKNINDDNWRKQEIIRAASNNEHWFSKFGTGSNETLAIEDIDIKVKEFFEKYYSADLMTLVVITKDKIENTKKIIDNSFSKIKLLNINTNDLIIDKKILKSPSTIKYLPIENENTLILIWEVPFFRDFPTQNPLGFLGDLIGNEKKGSLYDIFTNKEYIMSLSCYVREIIFSKCLFCIELELTNLGLNNKKEIVNTIIDYINIIRENINTELFEELYNEKVKLLKYKFNHFEKYDCIDTAVNLCTTLHNYNIEPEKVLIIDDIQENYSQNIKKNLTKILDDLQINNLLLIIGSKKYNNEKYKNYIQKFPHYGTEYIIKNSIHINNNNNNNKAKLPSPNKFISTSNIIFDLKNKNPVLLENEINNITLSTYWMPNIHFNVPDICIYVSINLQIALKDIYIDTSILLYLMVLMEEINYIIYEFESACYFINLNYSSGKIYIKVRGNYKNINDVVETFLKNLVDTNNITLQKFNFIKKKLIKEDKNDIFKSPRDKVNDNFTKKIFDSFYTSKERLKIIKNINFENIIDVFHKILPYNETTLFISGNCKEEQAKNIQKLFKYLPQKKHNYSTYIDSLYRIPSKTEIYNIKNKNDIEENNSSGYYIYIDTLDFTDTNWVKPLCLLKLLDKIISSEYFDELRTKEMYGYIVFSKILNLGNPSKNNFFYLYLVQSPNKTNDDIINRTQKFINNFKNILIKMKNDEFLSIKNSFITGLLSKFNNLQEMTSYIFYNEIETKYLKYNSREFMAEQCKKISLEDLIDFYNTKFINNDNKIIIKIFKKN